MIFELVRFTAEYTDAVLALEAECFDEPYSRASLEKTAASERDCAFVAVCDGKTVGYAEYGDFVDNICIMRVEVDPQFRRNGVATALLDAAQTIALSRSIDSLTLEVRASNEAARNLYERHGFVCSGIRTGYYSRPREDAVIYSKTL